MLIVLGSEIVHLVKKISDRLVLQHIQNGYISGNYRSTKMLPCMVMGNVFRSSVGFSYNRG